MLAGGFEAWRAAGLPVETTPDCPRRPRLHRFSVLHGAPPRQRPGGRAAISRVGDRAARAARRAGAGRVSDFVGFRGRQGAERRAPWTCRGHGRIRALCPPRRTPLTCLDVAPLHVVEVLALDADQPARRRRAAANARRARRRDAGRPASSCRCAPARPGSACRPSAVSTIFQSVISVISVGLAVDRPALAVVVRRAVRGAVIDVAADAEAELGVLVEHRARIFALGARS